MRPQSGMSKPTPREACCANANSDASGVDGPTGKLADNLLYWTKKNEAASAKKAKKDRGPRAGSIVQPALQAQWHTHKCNDTRCFVRIDPW